MVISLQMPPKRTATVARPTGTPQKRQQLHSATAAATAAVENSPSAASDTLSAWWQQPTPVER